MLVRFNSFVATLEVADDEQYTALWQGQPPTAFEAGLTAIRPMVAAIKTKGTQQSASTKGSAQQLKNLRLLSRFLLFVGGSTGFRTRGKSPA